MQAIELKEIKPNLHRINVNNKSFWLSYETIVAFYADDKLVCSENVWSTTTGKHLNEIEPDKKKRIKHSEFEERLKNL